MRDAMAPRSASGRYTSDTTPPERRFWRRIRFMPSGCWEWTGFVNRQTGYGEISVAGKHRDVHRWVYERTWGTLQSSREVVMHTCDNRKCVRVVHLRAGTQRDNVLDMQAKGRRGANQYVNRAMCNHGHEYTAENTRTVSRGTHTTRVCRRCELLATWRRRGKHVS